MPGFDKALSSRISSAHVAPWVRETCSQRAGASSSLTHLRNGSKRWSCHSDSRLGKSLAESAFSITHCLHFQPCTVWNGEASRLLNKSQHSPCHATYTLSSSGERQADRQAGCPGKWISTSLAETLPTRTDVLKRPRFSRNQHTNARWMRGRGRRFLSCCVAFRMWRSMENSPADRVAVEEVNPVPGAGIEHARTHKPVEPVLGIFVPPVGGHA